MLALALVLALAGCGGGDDDGEATDGGAAAETQTETAEEDAPEPPQVIPETPVKATLEEGYKVVDGNTEVVAPEELPVEPGSVEARWYTAGNRYVVMYAGLSLDETDPLCPGNSILVDTSFDHVSNSPTAEGACAGPLADNAPAQGRGVVACGPLLIYETDIPTGTEGTLYASIETFRDGAIFGLTSVAQSSAGTIPQIRVGAAGYRIPEGTLPDGTTELIC